VCDLARGQPRVDGHEDRAECSAGEVQLEGTRAIPIEQHDALTRRDAIAQTGGKCADAISKLTVGKRRPAVGNRKAISIEPGCSTEHAREMKHLRRE
jgi:hypothetical protein